MTQIAISSAQEAAFNAAGEAMIDIGPKVTLSYEGPWCESPHFFCVTGRVRKLADESGEYGAASGATAAEALRKYADKANAILATPLPLPKLDGPGVKDAACKLLYEFRRDHPDYVGPAVDELASSIAALPVKE